MVCSLMMSILLSNLEQDLKGIHNPILSLEGPLTGAHLVGGCKFAAISSCYLVMQDVI